MQFTTTLLTVASFGLTALTVSNAFYHKKQFYPAIVYLTKSNPSMAVFYLQALIMVILVGKILKKIFFGTLRAAESEHLMERGWYAVTETCLAFTVFRDDFSAKFVAQFTLLLLCKCFHWLSEDRVDYMERSPVITILFHARMMGLIGLLSAIDSYFCSHAYFTTLLRGASSQIVFGFEYAILMSIVFHVAIKYILHTADLRNVHPWENKAVYLLYSELIIDFLRCMLYTAFVAVMIRLHTFPLFSIRPFYLTVRAFKKAVHDVIMSRKAIHAMNTLFADATPEELAQGDHTCIICREDMSSPGAKRLPCSHTFHAACLRSWFQRQQTCPTCRADILNMVDSGARVPPAAGGGAVPAANAVPHQPQAGAQPHHHQHPFHPNMAAMFPFIPPGFLPHAPQQQHQQRQGAGVQPQAGAAAAPTAPQPGTQAPPMPPPPFPMMPPMPPPFPLGFPLAPNTAGLSETEVRAMEGRQREAVEARIRCLHNIQTLLDAAAIQLQQYTSILSALAASPEFQQRPSPPAEAPAPAASGQAETEEPGPSDAAAAGGEDNPFKDLKATKEAEELREARLRRFNNNT